MVSIEPLLKGNISITIKNDFKKYLINLKVMEVLEWTLNII